MKLQLYHTNNHLTVVVFFAFIFVANAQVGIGNTNPQQELHISGSSSTIRIDGLNSANSVFNNGIDASVVMIDTNGDLILQDRVDDFPLDASDTTGATTFMATPIAVDSPTGGITTAIGYTATFTLTRETLMEVVFWTGVNITQSGSGTTYALDGKPRLFGGLVYDVATGQDIIYSASTHTNASLGGGTGVITTGLCTIGGNGFINLPIGTHTINLLLFTSGGQADPSTGGTEGVRATFGANTYNRFQIIYHN